jgi:hypothetical protein
MGKRISISEVAKNEGFDDPIEMVEEFFDEGMMPTCCSDGCYAEPDGHCVHGHPSILLELMVI